MRKHDFDVTAFVWGVLFLIAGALALVDEFGGPQFDVKWLLPAGLVAIGVGGIAKAVRQSDSP